MYVWSFLRFIHCRYNFPIFAHKRDSAGPSTRVLSITSLPLGRDHRGGNAGRLNHGTFLTLGVRHGPRRRATLPARAVDLSSAEASTPSVSKASTRRGTAILIPASSSARFTAAITSSRERRARSPHHSG